MKIGAALSRNGQVLIEVAIILPALLLLIFGLVDFGRALYTKHTMGNAARAGAREAAITKDLVPEPTAPLSSSSSAPADSVRNSLFNADPASILYALEIMDPTGAPVTGMAKPGHLVRVTVSWLNFPMLTPLNQMMALLSDPRQQESNALCITAAASMRYELMN